MAEPATELSFDSVATLAAEEHEVTIVGRSPWYLAWRRLRRNYVAFAFLGLFVLIVLACALAPLYAHHVAGALPNSQHVLDTITVHVPQVDVVAKGCVVGGRHDGSTPVRP